MACNACSNKQRHTNDPDTYKIFSNYKYLTDRQINARLASYKKRYCTQCEKYSICDFSNFVICKDIK